MQIGCIQNKLMKSGSDRVRGGKSVEQRNFE